MIKRTTESMIPNKNRWTGRWNISLTVSTKKFETQNSDLSKGVYELERKIDEWFKKRELSLRLKKNKIYHIYLILGKNC